MMCIYGCSLMMLCVVVTVCVLTYDEWKRSFMFFFFKQKTAYEMRISNWSSDVCSSDLCPQPVYIERRSVRRSGPRRFDQDIGLAGQGVQHGVIRRSREEIGRASGRERVCQYV